MRIAVIGAGASGMIAAIEASKKDDNTVTVFEKSNRVGKKILSSGNGRCNFTNRFCDASHYHGSGAKLVEKVFERFDNVSVQKWFEDKGMIIREDRFGRLYPYSDRAGSVLDVLRMNLNRINISVVMETEIVAVEKNEHGFILFAQNGVIKDAVFDRVILACGGLASKAIGGTERGYELLKGFGHRIVPLGAALTKIYSNDASLRQLQGIRTDAELTLVDSRMNKVAESKGEIQFTKEGISGPAAFDVSRYVGSDWGERNWKGKSLIIDFCPFFSSEKLELYFRKKIELYPDENAASMFTGCLHRMLGNAVLKKAGIQDGRKLGDLNDGDIKRLVFYSKGFQFVVSAVSKVADAQVTTGGVDASEIKDTLESVYVDGLYVTGELIDIDGDCGGYNLQWAWSSGYVAGNLAGEIENAESE
ncbi:MAG: aminoacetone oxidase family FAD-binding enzyme [Erysipelotrichaceae bacterium]|nr:aminoacetone oxidase family FAD-binding enzyme [Erysipelotrichaceae bacterium]MBQ6476416.1 aminoacetone oxidase family FAD-binding enzyme [Clostridia bacterium]